MKALVINASRNGLAVIRSLARHGIPVIGVDHTRHAVGLWSRYCHAAELVPYVTDGEEQFIDRVLQLAEKHEPQQKIVLFPTHDAHLLTFVRHWDVLSPRFLPAFETSQDIVNRCLDKTRIIDLAAASQVPCPRCYVSTEDRFSAGAARPLDDLAFPVIIKPAIRTSPQAMRQRAFRLRVCDTKSELQAASRELQAKEIPYIVQEIIPGGDDTLYTAGIFALRGVVTAAFTGRKLRQFPPDFGECCLGEIVREPILVDYATRLVKTAGYTGIAQIEFKKWQDDFFLIEFNPRSWSWIGLSVFAGVDLPWIAFQTASTGQPHFASQRRWRGRWGYLGADLGANSKRRQKTPLFRLVRQSLFAECHALWKLTDPFPAISEVARATGFPLPLAIQRMLTRLTT